MVGTALWIAFFSADFQDAVMRRAGCVREPTTRDWDRLVQVARYMRWTANSCIMNTIVKFVSGESPHVARLVVSDGAGHHLTRHSCSGGLIAVNSAIMTSWGWMSGTAARSSREAEQARARRHGARRRTHRQPCCQIPPESLTASSR